MAPHARGTEGWHLGDSQVSKRPRLLSPLEGEPNRGKGKEVTSHQGRLAHRQESLPPDLAIVFERWEALPEAVRACIVAMVRAAKTERTDQAIGRTGHGEDLAVLLHGMMGGGERPAAGRGLDRDDAQA